MAIEADPELTPAKTGNETEVHYEVGDVFAFILMGVLGLVGLILASGAQDNEMYLFGMSLFAFALLFLFGYLKRHFDRRDALRASARGAHHG